MFLRQRWFFRLLSAATLYFRLNSNSPAALGRCLQVIPFCFRLVFFCLLWREKGGIVLLSQFLYHLFSRLLLFFLIINELPFAHWLSSTSLSNSTKYVQYLNSRQSHL